MADLPCDIHGNSYGVEVCPDCLEELLKIADLAINLPPKLMAALNRLRPEDDEPDAA